MASVVLFVTPLRSFAQQKQGVQEASALYRKVANLKVRKATKDGDLT